MMMNNTDDLDDHPRKARLRLSQGSSPPSENWDDDFEFHPRAPGPSRKGKDDATNALERHGHSHNQEEIWDDAYEDEDLAASPTKRPPKVDDDEVEDWDSSDNEATDQHEPEHERNINSSLQEYRAGFEEEDKTVTARSTISSRGRGQALNMPIPSFSAHTQNLQHPPLPPIPFHVSPLSPQQPAPSTSPTLSSFSIPLSSNRASIYSQEPLMPTTSNSSAPHLSLSVMRAYPQSAGSTPPRKGRRLRKKSRPPEADIFELEDREPDQLPVPAPESPALPSAPPSPPRPITPPQNTPLPQPTPSPSLLARIGSLKRWARRSIGPEDPAVTGSRRGKSSIGPNETSRTSKSSVGPEELPIASESLEHNPRAVSPTPAPSKSRLRRSRGDSASGQKAGWFFRSGGGSGKDREEADAPVSLPVPAAVPPRTPDPSPSKRSAALTLRRRNQDQEADGDEGTPKLKRTQDCPVPALKAGGSVFKAQEQRSPVKVSREYRPVSLQPQAQSRSLHPLQFPRHLGSTSIGRSAGTSLSVVVVDAGTPPVENERRERESGMRSLMNGVRRLSLVGGAHKRTKSTGEAAAVEAARNGKESTTEKRPVSKMSIRPRPASQASMTETRPYGGAEASQNLLPPVELNSPSSSQFARRGSLPWADYDPTEGVFLHYESPVTEVPVGGLVPSRLPLPLSTLTASKHPPERQLYSASATSLLTGSPEKLAPESTPPPATPSNVGLSPGSLPGPTFPTLPPSSSPRAGSVSTIPSATHSASLGRTMGSPAHTGSALRRNSLGDLKSQTPHLGELKIPARISRAQQGLRRDLGMVREFAACVEQLKQLQDKYSSLIDELRAAYEASPTSTSRPISPAQVQFHLPSRPSSQMGIMRKPVIVNPNPSFQSMILHTSATQPDIGHELVRLEHEYGIWWECAELLVELGGGSVPATGAASNPNLASHSMPGVIVSARELEEPLSSSPPGLPVVSMSEPRSIFEHALVERGKGPPQASPPQWRASTGRHDLSARQLQLLKDMLSTPDPASLPHATGPYGYGVGYPPPHYPYGVQAKDQQWVPWNPSAVTLPSEESSTDPHLSGTHSQRAGKKEKRRASRLGLLGLRELLRGLKRNAIAEGRLNGAHHQGMPRSESSASNSAEDDYYNRRRSPWHQHDEHHRGRIAEDTAPNIVPMHNAPPKSPRRPSLASIFRLGQKTSKNGSDKSKGQPSNGNRNSTTEDEDDRENDIGDGVVGEYSDWERMSRSDLDLTTTGFGSGMATIRGKRKPPLSNSGSDPNLLQSHLLSNGTVKTPMRIQTSSQNSLRDTTPSSGTPPQPSKLPLSIAEEDSTENYQKSNLPDPVHLKKGRTSSWSQVNPAPRPGSRNGKAAMTGTVRSAPPADLSSAPDPKLALTPETIKPLLEYAREVSMRLGECINEVQTLLSATVPVKTV